MNFSISTWVTNFLGRLPNAHQSPSGIFKRRFFDKKPSARTHRCQNRGLYNLIESGVYGMSPWRPLAGLHLLSSDKWLDLQMI